MPSYLGTTENGSCVSSAEVKALHRLLVQCAFNASSVAVIAAFAKLVEPSSAAVFCVFSFFLSLFLLDTFSLSAVSCHKPLQSIGAVVCSPQVFSLLLLVNLLNLARCPGQQTEISFVVSFGLFCIVYVAFGIIYYLAISKLYFNSFLQGYFQGIIIVILSGLLCLATFFCFLLVEDGAVSEIRSSFGQFSSNINRTMSYYQAESCINPYFELALEIFTALIFAIGSFFLNEQLTSEIRACYLYELSSFEFLKNTAEAKHLFDDEVGKRFEKSKAAFCSLNRFNFERIQEEAARRECVPPKFLAKRQQGLLASEKVHIRVLRRLPDLVWGIIFAKQNDILEVDQASHSELWWKAKLIERAGSKREEVKEEDGLIIPSQINLCRLLLTGGGVGGQGTCQDCFPCSVPMLSGVSFWSNLNQCINGKKPWPEWMERVLRDEDYFKLLYEFVEPLDGFERRSLVLVGDPELTTPIAETLEKHWDWPFVAGFKVPEETRFWCWKNEKKEKQKLTQAIRSTVNRSEIPVITTKTPVDDGLRNSEFAPLVVLVGWMKKGKITNSGNLCKECDLTFDAELESCDLETAAEEVLRLWEEFHEGPQWIPTQWLH